VIEDPNTTPDIHGDKRRIAQLWQTTVDRTPPVNMFPTGKPPASEGEHHEEL
jgi:hypothetical protein